MASAAFHTAAGADFGRIVKDVEFTRDEASSNVLGTFLAAISYEEEARSIPHC